MSGRWFQAALAGGLHALALSPWVGELFPGASAWLQSAALLWWVSLLDRSATPRQAAGLAWLYGSVWLIGATGWMFVSLHRYGELPAWLAALAVYLLCAALALYLAAAGWLWRRWRTRRPGWDAMLLGAVWLLAELARAALFTGFPWGASGYGLIDTGWAWLAPWVGVYGMGALWAAALALLALLARAPGAGGRTTLLGVVLAGWTLAGSWLAAPLGFTKPHGEPLKVTLLQGNVPQDQKFIPEYQWPMLLWHARELLHAEGDLVVAPETAIPLLPAQLPDGYWDQLTQRFAADAGRYALFGMPLGDFDSGYTNSVVGLSAKVGAGQGGFYQYDKHHLVPFGEFIPWGFRWFVDLMNMPLGDFMRGPLSAPSFPVKGQRVAPNICYEDLFGEELATRFVDAAQAPTILVNVSNLAWFGEQVAIHQHLQIARLRSLEFQVPTLRATNTGATVVIDAQGQVQAALAPNSRGVLQAGVQGQAGVTPYAWWAGRWGLTPLMLAAAGGCAAAWMRRRASQGAITH